MSKREDSGYIKRLSRSYNNTEGLTKTPLLIIDYTSILARKANDRCNSLAINDKAMDDLMSMNIPKVLEELMPVKSLVVLDKTHDIVSAEHRGTFPYNYYVASVLGGAFSIRYHTLSEGMFVVVLQYDEDAKVTKYTSHCMTINDAMSDRLTGDQETFLLALFTQVYAFFKELSESDLYPVEVKGTQHRKVHAKKPWARSDLSTIQFLNRLPAEKQPHKGGTHSSPRYHQRRGAWRSMANPRFKNHPKYGDRIWIKPYWAGEKEATVNGVTYKVL